MRIIEAMSRDVKLANPDQSIMEAAKLMAECDCGVLPVGENDRLIGMITDRDIVVRAVAQGKAAQTKIRDVMSTDVKYCFEEDDINKVARNMGDLQIRRLAVLDQNKRLTGIVSLGDIAITDEVQSAAEALCGISERAEAHSMSHQAPH